ncbi:hypothetical protein FOPG_16638 [Fusarium oxysporum f. sp. conglutinans race 2 54008]|uniref:Uncharacterized protein n=2 Tax=Fusarium oxysporum TaxID=5507 RepID=X0GV16_FUSOX|nr:hypothetical protein FOVG_10136 [Fusarium oxysporum f. sp. pisi HDV247]EXL67228.1 hypothetical protein FOPG_16638 [Fusarium oxysporum f. sp. conglutinans race 2 54008]
MKGSDEWTKPSTSQLGDAMPLSEMPRDTVSINLEGELALNAYDRWLWLIEVKSKAFKLLDHSLLWRRRRSS